MQPSLNNDLQSNSSKSSEFSLINTSEIRSKVASIKDRALWSTLYS
jgi:hypothetical protein